jgi:hypothetical protein
LLGLWGTETEGRRETEGELKKEGGKGEINTELKRKWNEMMKMKVRNKGSEKGRKTQTLEY